MSRKIVSVVFALMVGICIFSAADAQVPFSQGQQYMSRVGTPVLAPGGETFFVSVNEYVPGSGPTGYKVRRFDFDGKEQPCGMKDFPQYMSPDGRWIASMQTRDGRYGLWLYDTQAHTFKILTKIYRSDHFLGHTTNKNLSWSPDSRYIAYCAGEKEPAVPESDVKVYDRIMYKTRTSFTDNITTHIFIIPVGGGTARQFTTGNLDYHSVAWHPDGTKIAYVTNCTDDPDDNHNNDIMIADAETGRAVQFTDTPGTEYSPQWSPDGKWIAYLAAVRPVNTKDSQAENARLFVRSADGSEPVWVNEKLDRRIRSWQWSPDGKYIYFTASDRGARPLYRVPFQGGEIQQLVDGEVSVGGFAVSTEKKRIVYTLSSQTDPGELWVAGLDGKKPKQITRFQDEFKNKVTMSVPEMFWFKSFDNIDVQGWLVKPFPFDPNKKYPLIMTIHGGPHGGYGYSISSSNQQLAEEGFGVIYINPRGSTGYGQAFVDGTINNWGGGDYKDLMAGLDYAISQNDWIDTDRLGVTGGSYGGYMTNWVITQTDRFKAAVTRASVSNLISFYGNSLYQLLIETEFPGELWENYDLLWHWSPMKHVANVTTPTLFIHGENDHDVPITQAEEMFIALKKLGVETVFARYPGEGHGFRRPDHRADSSRRTLEWFTKYLEPGKVVRK